MHKPIYEQLKRVVKAQSTTTYGAIASLANLEMENPAHRNTLTAILGEISSYEHQQGRPLLSAAVLLQDSNIPGQGFFTLANELGLYGGQDDVAFFCKELACVHAYWK